MSKTWRTLICIDPHFPIKLLMIIWSLWENFGCRSPLRLPISFDCWSPLWPSILFNHRSPLFADLLFGHWSYHPLISLSSTNFQLSTLGSRQSTSPPTILPTNLRSSGWVRSDMEIPHFFSKSNDRYAIASHEVDKIAITTPFEESRPQILLYHVWIDWDKHK